MLLAEISQLTVAFLMLKSRHAAPCIQKLRRNANIPIGDRDKADCGHPQAMFTQILSPNMINCTNAFVDFLASKLLTALTKFSCLRPIDTSLIELQGYCVRIQKFEQLRWPSGKRKSIGFWSCRLGFDSEVDQTNDFKIGIHQR